MHMKYKLLGVPCKHGTPEKFTVISEGKDSSYKKLLEMAQPCLSNCTGWTIRPARMAGGVPKGQPQSA
eukprot:809676-Pelagomonas_calceolata.AAC.3